MTYELGGNCVAFRLKIRADLKPTLNIPNLITASRVALTPLFIWLLLSNDAILVQIAAAVIIVAAVSDWYDGWYARRHNETSAFGSFFDPLADKVFIGAAFFAFVALDLVALWMVIVIVARDAVTTAMRVLAERKGMTMATSRLAKWKTALQLVFLWYVVIAWVFGNVPHLQDVVPATVTNRMLSSDIVDPIMLVLVALSLYTALKYIIDNRKLFQFGKRSGNVAGTTS